MMSIYEDASWHHGKDFPESLPKKNGVTHTGIFLSWCIERGLISEKLKENTRNEIERLKKREITGAELIIKAMNGIFSEDNLNELGNSFAKDYYVDETDFGNRYSSFATDYINVFDSIAEEDGFEYETFYHIDDTFESYDIMKALINFRFEQWTKYKNLINSQN